MSDAAALVKLARRAATLRGQKANPLSGTMDTPDLREFRHSALAMVSIALLEKTPQPLVELQARTGLSTPDIHRAMVVDNSIAGSFLIFVAGESGQLPIDAVVRGGHPYYAIGITDGASRNRVAQYCADSLAESANSRVASVKSEE